MTKTDDVPPKPIVWLKGEIRTPPFSDKARRRAGWLLRRLQAGVTLAMPDSRSMPTIGRRCGELRIGDDDSGKTWRIVYRIDEDAILIVDVFPKKSQKTPTPTIDACKRRLRDYDRASG